MLVSFLLHSNILFCPALFYSILSCSVLLCSNLSLSVVFFSVLLCLAGQDSNTPLREASGSMLPLLLPAVSRAYKHPGVYVYVCVCVRMCVYMCARACVCVRERSLDPKASPHQWAPPALSAYYKHRRACSLPVCTHTHAYASTHTHTNL